MPSDITVDDSGQDLTFPLVGESSFSYRVNTSSSSGQHRFPSGSQLTYGIDKDTATVGGESSVTVEQAQEPSVTVTRSINPDSVPADGGVVAVTISINGSYGIGSVVEKLPADFSYVSGSVMPSDITATGDIVSWYDTDGTPGISRSEAVAAALDYLIRNEITRDEAIQVVNTYTG